mgnify:CR=1 FL=1
MFCQVGDPRDSVDADDACHHQGRSRWCAIACAGFVPSLDESCEVHRCHWRPGRSLGLGSPTFGTRHHRLPDVWHGGVAQPAQTVARGPTACAANCRKSAGSHPRAQRDCWLGGAARLPHHLAPRDLHPNKKSLGCVAPWPHWPNAHLHATPPK